MDARMKVTSPVPHGRLWKQGLRLAESAIEAGFERPGRWDRAGTLPRSPNFREAEIGERSLESLAA